jgi:hypothetical protein
VSLAGGLVLAVASAVAINGGYALQHREASSLPALTPRRPIHSLALLFRQRLWLAGFLGGIFGWVLYVAALALAPLSLVQACAAGGVAILALGLGRLARTEQAGVAAAVVGLALLGASLGSHTKGTHGDWRAVAIWMGSSLLVAAVAAKALPRGAGLGVAAGVMYAAGDVGTKAAVGGGGRLLFVPALLACHGLAFVFLQLAFQRGGRLATAGMAVLWTNALPIVAGTALFGEAIPGGAAGGARIASFALLVAAAAFLAREEAPAPAGLTPAASATYTS